MTGMAEELLPAWTLVQASHLVARGFQEVFGRVGLTPTQFGVLAELAEGGRPTQADLARVVMLRPQSMGELIESLLVRGLVERDGPGGRGRRAAITITDAGRAALAAAWPGVRAFNAPESLGLTDSEARELDRLLSLVTQALSTEPRRATSARPFPSRAAPRR